MLPGVASMNKPDLIKEARDTLYRSVGQAATRHGVPGLHASSHHPSSFAAHPAASSSSAVGSCAFRWCGVAPCRTPTLCIHAAGFAKWRHIGAMLAAGRAGTGNWERARRRRA